MKKNAKALILWSFFLFPVAFLIVLHANKENFPIFFNKRIYVIEKKVEKQEGIWNVSFRYDDQKEKLWNKEMGECDQKDYIVGKEYISYQTNKLGDNVVAALTSIAVLTALCGLIFSD